LLTETHRRSVLLLCGIARALESPDLKNPSSSNVIGGVERTQKVYVLISTNCDAKG
jgi:hypothetical protein